MQNTFHNTENVEQQQQQESKEAVPEESLYSKFGGDANAEILFGYLQIELVKNEAIKTVLEPYLCMQNKQDELKQNFIANFGLLLKEDSVVQFPRFKDLKNSISSIILYLSAIKYELISV